MGKSIVNFEDRNLEEEELFKDFRSRCLSQGVDALITRDGLDYWVFINCRKNVVIDGNIDTTLKFPIRVPAVSMANTEDVCGIAYDHVKRIAPMIERGFIDANAGMM